MHQCVNEWATADLLGMRERERKSEKGVYMCVCARVHVWVCMCVHACVRNCACVRACMHACVSMWVCMHANMCVSTHSCKFQPSIIAECNKRLTTFTFHYYLTVYIHKSNDNIITHSPFPKMVPQLHSMTSHHSDLLTLRSVPPNHHPSFVNQLLHWMQCIPLKRR